MIQYKRRADKAPQVYYFENHGNHRKNLIEGHAAAAWALDRSDSPRHAPDRASVLKAADGNAPHGVHVVGWRDREQVFILHPGEYLVWENDEFRAYDGEDFRKLFEPLPVAKDYGGLINTPTRNSLAQQRDGAE